MTGKKILRILIIIIVAAFSLFVMHKMWRHYNYLRKQIKRTTYKSYHYNAVKTDTGFHGYILAEPYILYNWKFGVIVIMDTKGKILFSRHVNGVVYDFRQWKTKDGIRYTYIYHNKFAHHSKSALAPGNVVILDSMLNVIREVHLLSHDDVDAKTNQGLDLHDFFLMSDHHYFTLSHYEKNVRNIPDSVKHDANIILAVPTIQEVVNDSVVWQWDASKFPEFYAHSHEHNDYTDTAVPQDYMHVNAIWLDPIDSNLLVSFRHEWQIIKISRKDGSIMWRLGGPNSDFPLTPEQQFMFQHDVKTVDDGKTIIFLDNGDSVNRRNSRILEFRLDEQNKKVLSFNAFNIPEEFSMYMGSVDKYGDNYFIAGGSAKYMMMVNRKTGKILFEIKSNQSSYRGQYVDSIYGLNNIIHVKRGLFPQ